MPGGLNLLRGTCESTLEASLHTPVTAGSILRYNARHFPEEPALVMDDKRRTHRELYQRGARLAVAFEMAGLMRQHRVAILSRNNIEFYEVYAAGWIGGIIVATVNYRLAAPEIAYIVNDAAPRIFIFEACYADLVDSIRGEISEVERYVCIGGSLPWAEDYESFISRATKAAPASGPAPGDPSNLIYTSGTTGRPKGCIHTHEGLGEIVRSIGVAQTASTLEKFLLVMPVFHIGGLACSLAHLSFSAPVIMMREFDSRIALQVIEREGIAVTLLAPTMVQMLLDADVKESADLSSLRTVIYSASPMPSNTLQQGLARLGPVFVQIYGQTEVIHTMLPRELHKQSGTELERTRLLSAGIPLPGVTVRIVDDQWQDVSGGETGEIISLTKGGAKGYWNAGAATVDTFRDGWTASGDIGRFDDHGFLYIVDRKKDVIISGGENVYSREVEEALLSHPAIVEAAVVGLPDPVWGEAVCAVVRLSSGASATEEEIIGYVKGQIASFKKPKSVVFVDELPKLVSGKVDKISLRKAIAS